MGQAERFHWLVAPASTIIQPSAVHTGLCDDPAAELDHLVATLVDRLGRPRRPVQSPEAALRGGDRVLERLAPMRARHLDDQRRTERRRSALGRRERSLEPVGGGVGRPGARLGQQQLEPRPADPDGPIRIAGLGPDDLGEAGRHPVVGVVGEPARQFDEEHRRRPAVPGMAGGLVAEGGQPVLAGVEFDGAADRARCRGPGGAGGAAAGPR